MVLQRGCMAAVISQLPQQFHGIDDPDISVREVAEASQGEERQGVDCAYGQLGDHFAEYAWAHVVHDNGFNSPATFMPFF